MKRHAVVVLAAILIAGPALAMDIFVDYNPEYAGSSIKTFAWAKTEETGVKQANPLLHQKIVNSIEGHMTAGGLQRVEKDPDVYVTYHGSSKDEVRLDTSYYGYGYPAGWGYGGYGRYYGRYYGTSYGYSSATTTVSQYKVGSLVIDIWDAETDELIWRGIAGDIMVKDNPAKMEKKIDKALNKMVKKWQKMKKQMP